MTVLFEADITPVPKPRMTRADAWKKRPAVERYWAYKDQLVIEALGQDFTVPEANYHLTFHLPMPKSWSKKRRAEMVGRPHQQKPDKDNLEKGFLDALCDEDEHIYDGRVTKLWSERGRIVLTDIGGVNETGQK